MRFPGRGVPGEKDKLVREESATVHNARRPLYNCEGLPASYLCGGGEDAGRRGKERLVGCVLELPSST